MTRVLWVDDDAGTWLAPLAAPLFTAPNVRLEIATNASDAVRSLREREYDVVVVDVRLPPGSDHRWIEIYNQQALGTGTPRLGLTLVRSLLAPGGSMPSLVPLPTWLSPDRLAFFSVETPSEVRAELGDLDVVVMQKQASTSTTALRDLVEYVLSRQANTESRRGHGSAQKGQQTA